MSDIYVTSLFKEKTNNKRNQVKMVKNLVKEKNKKIDSNFEKEIEKIASNLKMTENAKKILEKRYLIKDKDGNPAERPQDIFIRVAKSIAEADLQYGASTKEYQQTTRDFLKMLISLDFLPNSPTLRGAGRKIHQLSACFVLPIEDNMEGIFNTLKITALVHKGGGGTGFSFGHIRPSGDRVGSTDGVAGGPISFMKIFDTMAKEVMQGGVRVGANMGILPVHHPDIETFISCKSKENKGKQLQNFNLSVAVTDTFMEAVIKEKDYELINPRNNEVIKKISAKKIFDKMVENAWDNGDPGIIFIDEINRYNPTPQIGKIESTNPCGEQPLLPYESCNLGSINLKHMIKDNAVDWEKLKDTVHKATHFLDNVIDVNRFSDPKIEEMTKANRKIGLGVMGFADLLVMLNIPYNSKKAESLAEKIMKFVNDNTKQKSAQLAKTRGPFANFKGSIYDKKNQPKLRNAAFTSIAPTGTLSLIADCSGGIEPFFALVYKKKSLWKSDGSSELEQIFVNQHFEKVAKKEKFHSKKIMEQIAQEGSVQEIEEIPEEIKKIFVTAQDISPEWHIRIQAAFQKDNSSAVSKTINFPNKATKEDIANSYILAYKLKCKGTTIYRDGSRDVQVLTKGEKNNNKKEDQINLVLAKPRKRPEVVNGRTYKTKTAYGSLYVTINDDEQGQPFEVFAQMGKAGGFFAAKVEAISRLISTSLRSGIKPDEIVNQLKGIRGPSPIWTEEGTILSIPDAIAKVLEKHLNKSQVPLDFNSKSKFITKEPSKKNNSIADMGIAPACPECGNILELGEGCLKCPGCGFSKCG